MNHPINKALLFTFAFWVYSTTMYGCGPKPTDKAPDVIQDATEIVPVQLNDMFNQVFPSQSYTLAKQYRFAPPSAVLVVGGTFSGRPGQYMHARIKVGAAFCEYQAYEVTDKILELMDCYDIPQNEVSTLNAGTVIELQNYDAPGLLLEVQFLIAR